MGTEAWRDPNACGAHDCECSERGWTHPLRRVVALLSGWRERLDCGHVIAGRSHMGTRVAQRRRCYQCDPVRSTVAGQ